MVDDNPRSNNLDRVRLQFKIDRAINLRVCPGESLDLSHV